MRYALSSSTFARKLAVFVSSSVIRGSYCLSPALTWPAEALKAFFPVHFRMNRLLEVVALLASAAAIGATTATSGDGPLSNEWKKFGQWATKFSLRLV